MIIPSDHAAARVTCARPTHVTALLSDIGLACLGDVKPQLVEIQIRSDAGAATATINEIEAGPVSAAEDVLRAFFN